MFLFFLFFEILTRVDLKVSVNSCETIGPPSYGTTLLDTQILSKSWLNRLI